MDRLPQDYRPFHPKDPAYGTLNYDIGALNEHQKKTLNLRKATNRHENDIYLKMHPEIKGLISILLRHVLREQPLMQVHETVGKFFNRPRCEIVTDLLEYCSSTGQTFNFKLNCQPSCRDIETDDTVISYRNE